MRSNTFRLVLPILLAGMWSPCPTDTAEAGDEAPPYVQMNYGPTLGATLEVGPGNFAYKGIAIRLDPGPGGITGGHVFTVFDTDLMRFAAGWTGDRFIDWRGIAFDGAHNAHSKIVGSIAYRNPPSPGWGRPGDGSFDDPRSLGIDGNPYGPLPRSWLHWKGLYQHGDQVVLSYDLGSTSIRERPGLVVESEPPLTIFTRQIEIEPHEDDLWLHIFGDEQSQVSWRSRSDLKPTQNPGNAADELALLPEMEPPSDDTLDFGSSNFSIGAWIKTEAGGTILSKAAPDGPWVPKGKCFFVRDGRLGYDVGWLGVVQSRQKVNDNRWHHVAVTYRQEDGATRLFIDGHADGMRRLASTDGEGHRVRIGYTATDFVPPFRGQLDDVQIYDRPLDEMEIRALARSEAQPDGLIARWEFDEIPVRIDIRSQSGRG